MHGDGLQRVEGGPERPVIWRTGRTVSVTAFESRDALALVRKHARHLRAPCAQAMGARITDIAEMDLAVAHLRVPETV